MPSTVLAALPVTLIAAAGELGIDRARLLADSGLSIEALADVDGRVPFEQHARLWESLVRLGPPDLGVALGERVGVAALGVVGHAMAGAETVGAALTCLMRFRRLVLEDAVPEASIARGWVRLVQPLPPRFVRLRHPAVTAAAATLTILRSLSGVTVRAHRVTFQHASPEDTRAVREHFGVEPRFGGACNELVVDAAVLSLPNLRADPSLHAYLVGRAEKLAREVGEDDRLADRVRRTIVASLSQGEPSVGAVAKTLATSTRTLSRRLAAEGHTFAALLDEQRRERALSLVADPSRRVGEIAFALGYNDGTTFARAFRRWTGKTPEQWRRR